MSATATACRHTCPRCHRVYEHDRAPGAALFCPMRERGRQFCSKCGPKAHAVPAADDSCMDAVVDVYRARLRKEA